MEEGDAKADLLSQARPDATSTDPLFWSKVQRLEEADGCWAWTGATDMGYGMLKREGKKQQVHRYAYSLTHGPVTLGMHLVHRPARLQEVAPGKGYG